MRRRATGVEAWLEVARRVEAVLWRVAVLCLLALAVGQSLLATDARDMLSYVYRLEGVAYDPRAVVSPGAVEALYVSQRAAPPATVTLVLADRPRAPEVRILVNGVPVADFRHASVTLAVRPGDVLTVDAHAAATPVRVRVADVSDGLAAPREGQELRAEPLARVEVRAPGP